MPRSRSTGRAARPAAARRDWRRCAGASLIEVLISLVVTSVGVLSLASLEIVSKRNLREAGQRLQAAHLAYGLLERMRANSATAALQSYVTQAAPSLGGGRLGDTAPSPYCADTGTSCTPAQLASFDLWHWEQLMDGATERAADDAKVGGVTLATACLAAPAAGAGQPGLYSLTIAFRGDRELPSNGGGNPCGRGAVFDDGAPLYGASDQFRRTVTVQAWIVPAAAK